jgi:UbiD family decarboxylase
VGACVLNSCEDLPALTSWPEDGGPFLTLPLVETRYGSTNLGMYRIQIKGPKKTGFHAQLAKGGGFHVYQAEQAGVSLPVKIYLGGSPALILAAIAPLPEGISEYLLASFLLKRPIQMGRSPWGPWVLEAEFVLVGFVPPHIREEEGPFGDHYGFYSLAHPFPIIHIEGIFHRRDAIFPATVVGKPYQEDHYLGTYLQKLLSPLLKLVIPALKELWSYPEAGFHPLAGARARSSYEGELLTTGLRILGESQLSLTKCLFITDEKGPSPENFLAFWTYLWEHAPQIHIWTPTAMDTLDYTGPSYQKGSKLLIYSSKTTMPLPSEMPHLPPGIKGRVLTPGTLLVSLSGSDFSYLYSLPWPCIILMDDVFVSLKDFLWILGTRLNPATDVWSQSTWRQNHVEWVFPLILDARTKPHHPGLLIPREEVVQNVDKRWKEYFPKQDVLGT